MGLLDRGRGDEPEYRVEEVEEDTEKTFTRHTTEVTFVHHGEDDEPLTVDWDAKSVVDGFLVLSNFVDSGKPYRSKGMFGSGGVVKEAFMAIPRENIETFETVEREKKSIEYTAVRERRVRVDDE